MNKDKERKNEQKRKKLKIKEEHLRGWRSAQQILLEDLVEFANAMSPPGNSSKHAFLILVLTHRFFDGSTTIVTSFIRFSRTPYVGGAKALLYTFLFHRRKSSKICQSNIATLPNFESYFT